MIFNSINFLIFFSIFFILYWFVLNKKPSLQNLTILAGSYVFYAFADWRFLFLLIAISALCFYLGIAIEKENRPKQKWWLLFIGLLQGIGGLVIFKYFNFFISSFNELFHAFHLPLNLQSLQMIVPVGISFFTFRTVSYLLDIDKGKMKACTDWIAFFGYVAFFPSILSGPIDLARNFIPQLEKRRVFDPALATDGLRQILWGLFKKVAIADRCANITGPIFDNYHNYPGSSLLLSVFLYTIQVYADFSGYSDMAIGVGKLMGIYVNKNFEFPFFAQNIAEFWRKWHISLTSWVTEYVFTPLSIAFRNYGQIGLIIAILINLTIVGIWHGAKWTTVLYGFLHGCYFIPIILSGTMNKKKKIAKDKLFPNAREVFNVWITFSIVMFTFILFRSKSISDAFHYLIQIFSRSLLSIPVLPAKIYARNFFPTLVFIAGMFCLEWLAREKEYALTMIEQRWPMVIRWSFYYLLVAIIFVFAGSTQDFIYVQF